MTKTLRVIDPFFTVDTGDTFEYSDEAKMYISKHKEEFYQMDGDNINDIKSSFDSEFRISEEYAKTLIDEGYLEEVPENEKTPFVNIFDEIDRLLENYKKGVKNIEEDTIGLPACLKVERETVLSNLITILEHLKSLKK